MRLAAALLAALALVVVLTLVVRSCRNSALEESYKRYVIDAGQLTSASAKQGVRFVRIIGNSTNDPPERIRTQLRTLSTETRRLVQQAEDLDAPEKLRGAHQSLVSALQLRANGVESTQAQIVRIIGSQDDFASNLLATRVRRLSASDVIYEDNWVGPTKKILAEEGITGTTVPDKDTFLNATGLTWASPAGAKLVMPNLKRRTSVSGAGDDGSATGGNRHGTALAGVRAVPEGKDLSTSAQTPIKIDEDFKWEVTVENQGDFTEDEVIVRVTYQAPSKPEGETLEGVITDFAPKATKAVRVAGPAEPGIDEDANVIVQVVALPDERIIENNRKTYSVKFRR